MSNVYAKGTRALAICHRSGFAFPYREMVREPGTGYLVHWTESDGVWNVVDHPQNFPPRDLSDAIALRWASPDRDEAAADRTLLADNTGNILEFTTDLGITLFAPTSKGGYSN